MNFGDVTTSTLAITTGGAITQAASTAFTILRDSTINSGTFATTLANAGNDFADAPGREGSAFASTFVSGDLTLVEVGGIARLDVTSTGDVNITTTGGIEQDNAPQFDGDLALDSTIVATGDVTIDADADVVLGTLGVGGDLVVDTGGLLAVGDYDDGFTTVAGTTTVTATDDIRFAETDTNNSFAGLITLSGANAFVDAKTDLSFGAITLSAERLNVYTSGSINFGGAFSGVDLVALATDNSDITQTAAIEVSEYLSAQTFGGDVTLNNAANDFAAVYVDARANVGSAGTIVLTDANDLDLNGVFGEALTLTVGGDLTDGNAAFYQTVISGETVLTVTGDAVLDNALNDFGGAVTASAANLELVDGIGGLLLDDVTAGNLILTSTDGDITQVADAAIDANGETTVTATGFDADLSEAGNDFTGSVNVDAANLTLVDANALVLGALTATGDLIVTSGGALTDTVGDKIDVAGFATLDAGANAITLDNADLHDFNGELTLTGGDVTIDDVDDLTLGAVTAATFTLNTGR